MPHIILFTVDDMGWNDIGYQSTDIPLATPYLTTLMEKGIRLTHYYGQPSCTPSRVTMMTGKFAYKNGFQNYELQHIDSVGVPLSNKLLPAYMRDLGYSTVMHGKWNIGHCNSKYLPHERGFDHFIGYLCPGHGYSDHTCGMDSGMFDMIEGTATFSKASGDYSYAWEIGTAYAGTYDTLVYRNAALASFKKHASLYSDVNSVPLFMWAAQHGMHGERDSGAEPPEDLLSADNKAYLKVLEKRMKHATTAAGSAGAGVPADDDAAAGTAGAGVPTDDDAAAAEISDSSSDGSSDGSDGAPSSDGPSGQRRLSEEEYFFKERKVTASVLMSIDNACKDLVAGLEEVGMLSNAVIFVNSDNGGDTVYTKGHPGNNFPLRSEKFGYYEGGVRVPAFVFAPSLIATARVGTSFHGLMHHVDLLPTFYGLGGGDTTALRAADTAMDGMDMWAAINGGVTAPRSELVLNLPRSRTWKLGEGQTDEGVALRVGNYKLLLNHVVDLWFSPDPGKNFQDANQMMADVCTYNFYSIDEFSPECKFSNQLYDLEADPHERTNLWSEATHAEVKAELIARAEALCADQPNDYGQIIPEYYERNSGGSYTVAAETHEFYVTPWGCDAIS